MKPLCKALLNALALLLVLPAYVCFRMGTVALGRDKAFAGWSQAFALIPGLTGSYLRRAFYRLVLNRCGAESWVSFGAIFSHPTAALGQAVYVGPYCSLGDVTLCDDVMVGSHVSIANGAAQHGTERLDIPMREQPGIWPRVTIGRDTWIGERAVVLADVGEHCIIGAGSVITRPIPDYAVAAGVPARVVRYRSEIARADEPSAKTKSIKLTARVRRV